MIHPTKLLRGAFLALALLFLAPMTGIGGSFLGVEAAQAATVSKISVVGNTKTDTSEIIKLLLLHVGDVATPDKINGSIAALTATGLFKSVSVAMQGSVLVVKVSENPIVANVLFEGNKKFTDDNLVAMIDLMNRGTVDDAGLARDVQTITKAYTDAGYTGVKVSTKLDPQADGRVNVTFVIDEGGRTGIAAINFTGNKAIGAWTLKSIIKTHETGWLSWLFADDNYTQEQIDGDRLIIQQYYANHGYPDAQVTSATAEFNAQRNGYFINFTIIEGNFYKFGKIGLETSIAGLDTNQLTGFIHTREGDSFSQAEVDQSVIDISVEANNLGYPFADVRPREIRDPATGTFAVTYLLDQGAHVYIERINITGNTKTRDFVIRRELGFSEGDPFSRALVTQAKANIEALGFFSNVDVSASPGSAPDKLVLNIAVTEQSTGSYGVTAGYDSTSGILGELSLEEKNFLGRGQYLKASVGASTGGNSVELAFTEPYFMGLKMSAGIDLYRRVTDESSDNIYGTYSTGGQLTFGLPVTHDLRASVFGGVDNTMILDSSAPFSNIFGSGVGELGTSFNKAWIGAGLNYNTLDDQKHPTRGVIAQLTGQYVGWDYNFIKTEGKARWYTSILPDGGIVGSVKVQGGAINDFSGNGVNPLEDFTYGNTLVRGFAPKMMGPMYSSGGTTEPLGFTAYAGGSLEADFPIPLLPATYGLTGAVWADAAYIAGNGSGAPGPVDPGSIDQPFKSSIGASIIWDSPFGPLRGDFAYPLTYSSDEKAHLQYFALTLNNPL